jgi:GNAT superfamily N-acetyltransferase
VLGPVLVEPRWGRRGHGSRLLAAAVDHARTDGMTRAVIWLPEEDQVSRTFFLSAGWQPDGLVRALDTGAGELREIRLHVGLVA